jgi:hypothetical protein
MLNFSYDEDNIYSLKQSESFSISSYTDTNSIRLKMINSTNIYQ